MKPEGGGSRTLDLATHSPPLLNPAVTLRVLWSYFNRVSNSKRKQEEQRRRDKEIKV